MLIELTVEEKTVMLHTKDRMKKKKKKNDSLTESVIDKSEISIKYDSVCINKHRKCVLVKCLELYMYIYTQNQVFFVQMYDTK